MRIGKPLKTVILTAPAGWGKTALAETLKAEYGCTQIVDEWSPGTAITRGAVHLTNAPISSYSSAQVRGCVIVSRGWPE